VWYNDITKEVPMELNVDVIDNDTGEIYREGVLLANAHIYIVKKDGKIIKDEVEKLELDDIDGGGKLEVRNLFVEFPETVLELKRFEEDRKRAKEYWGY
jgi:hypothetical protein